MHEEFSVEEKDYVKQALAAGVNITEIAVVILIYRVRVNRNTSPPTGHSITVMSVQQETTRIRTAIQQIFQDGIIPKYHLKNFNDIIGGEKE